MTELVLLAGIADWWNGMLLFEQIMFAIAVPATVVLIIQLILLFVGMGASDADVDMEADVETDGASLFNLKLFSLRGIMAFLAIGGWVGLLLSEIGLATWLAGLLAFIAGAAVAVLIALVYKWFEKIESNGNIEIKSAVGKKGTVYIPVPAKGQGRGKVNVTVEDRLIEYDAITEEETLIPTNAAIEVAGVMDETTLIVRSV